MADDSIRGGTAVVDQNTGMSRGQYVGKQDNTATGSRGDGSMANIKITVPPEEPGIAAAAKKAMAANPKTGTASKPNTTPKGKIPASMKNAVPSYKNGTNRVPKTGLAMLHQDEAVLPKQKAAKLRAAKATGGDGPMSALYGK